MKSQLIKETFYQKVELEGKWEMLCDIMHKHPILYRLFFRKQMKEVTKELRIMNAILCNNNVKVEISYYANEY